MLEFGCDPWRHSEVCLVGRSHQHAEAYRQGFEPLPE